MMSLLPRRRSLYIKVLILIPASWFLVTILVSLNETSSHTSSQQHPILSESSELIQVPRHPIVSHNGVNHDSPFQVRDALDSDLMSPSAQRLRQEEGEPDSLSRVIPSWKRRKHKVDHHRRFNSKIISLRQHEEDTLLPSSSGSRKRGDQDEEADEVERHRLPQETRIKSNGPEDQDMPYVQSDQHRPQEGDMNEEEQQVSRHKYLAVLRSHKSQEEQDEDDDQDPLLHRSNVSHGIITQIYH
jgi:hypothetical protein